MKVLIISDMEGVAGISRWDQVSADKPGYEEGRRLYTEEINATVRGAFAGGATEVVVMDCHGAGGDRSFNSLIPDALDARCEFVVQTRWTEYTAMLEDGCDAALFVGQHAQAGAERGVLSHTVSSTSWHELRFNDDARRRGRHQRRAVRDVGLPGRARHRRRRRVRGGGRVARRRPAHAGGQDRARPFQRPPPLPRGRPRAARAGGARSVQDVSGAPVYDPGAPCTIAVELATPDHADQYRNRAGVTLTGPRSVESSADVVGRLARALL